MSNLRQLPLFLSLPTASRTFHKLAFFFLYRHLPLLPPSLITEHQCFFFILFLDISGNRHPLASPSVGGFWDSSILTTPFLFSSGSHGSPLLLLVPQGPRHPLFLFCFSSIGSSFMIPLLHVFLPPDSRLHIPGSSTPAHDGDGVWLVFLGIHGLLDLPSPGLCSVFSLILDLFPLHVLLALPL